MSGAVDLSGGPDGRRGDPCRRLTPWTTTAVVPTTAAVRATGAPTTPRRAARAGRRGMSGSFFGKFGFGLERGDEGLDGDAPAGDELAAGAAGG